ncbi:NADH-quinone oxidoreductase subunit C [Dyadobacter endophyticus]|jgi:NADH-quinone oxidoreductase subunit C|uniref:NADH-quinone oxidoreductase subunit C n=1 Tax=Dyadobacter endophyticus TaxID=1749036 RepID=A0ABQ1ZAZ3_9BACT|nr:MULTISPECIES: NADH-quinone oxidoreductase subunit C [Dyadobacter]GGH53800.1 NADH-quinone oxidoreductase subunit C [Dyadobacter endophyticus]SEI86545.1 NADH dehydrogenase subunit C [Dyadobacter sp. SG02]
MLTNQEVAEGLLEKFGDQVFNFEEPYGLLTLSTTREEIIPVMEFLKDHKNYQVIFLTDITGIQYPDNAGQEFVVVYHMHSFVHNFRIRIKVAIPEADIHIPTATGLFASANWMERETYDFFGILFDGHPNLKRILNIEEMDYFPMRKEYPMEDATREDKIDALFGR